MIVTRLIGGLGNQLFQYAYGLCLAEQSQLPLYLDDSAFKTYTLHALDIDRFAVTAERLPDGLRSRVPGRYRGASRLRDWLDQKTGRSLTLRREKPFGYQTRYLAPKADLYLDGYWQSERFFPGVEQRLREEFRPVESLSDESLRIADDMQRTEGVAVHVRRGDYVTDPEAARVFRTVGADYYRACLQDLAAAVSGLQVFLFSNDIPWCLENLDVGLPFTPVVHNDATTAWEDLMLMGQCRHAVIANSSFSWWGAWLGAQHADRRVYHPDPWFNPGTLDGSALGCESWISESDLKTPRREAA